MRQRNIYIAIMQAAQAGEPLMLTPREVLDLSRDEAIAALATNSISYDEWSEPLDWSRVDAYRERHFAHHKRV